MLKLAYIAGMQAGELFLFSDYAIVELFFFKKIPLSRCVEYVMDGSLKLSMDE